MVALVCLGSLFAALAFPAPPPQEILPPVAARPTEQSPPGRESVHQAQSVSPSAIPVLPRFWIPQGPAPIENGAAVASPNNQVAGAIEAVAPHPTNADVIYVGAVNGGIWKTTDGTSATPKWTALTDGQRSLSIGALKFDPTDRTINTLIAGIGRFSAFRRAGGPRTGLLLSTDGGNTWGAIDGGGRLVGSNISGVAVRGSTIVAAADTADDLVCNNIGLFRSTDGGKSFSLVSGTAGTGLPGGTVFDLTEDTGNTAVLYAPVIVDTNRCPKGTSGVYKSTDTGATWSLVSDAAMNILFNNATQVSKTAAGASNNVYAGIVNGVVNAYDWWGYSTPGTGAKPGPCSTCRRSTGSAPSTSRSRRTRETRRWYTLAASNNSRAPFCFGSTQPRRRGPKSKR